MYIQQNVNGATMSIVDKTSVVSFLLAVYTAVYDKHTHTHTFMQAKLVNLLLLIYARTNSNLHGHYAHLSLFVCDVSHFVYIKYNNIAFADAVTLYFETLLTIGWSLPGNSKDTVMHILLQFNCASLFPSASKVFEKPTKCKR